MFYIHQTASISPQETFGLVDLGNLHECIDGKLQAIEPAYNGIPPGVLRRMGKAVRMGVGSAMAVLADLPKPDGIIIGCANGGKEDSVKFLNQIVEYNEGLLTPINFVQSTPNAIAAQIGLITNNHGYNITHLHLGLAFEFALIDADMMLAEHPGNTYLVGGVDDISIYYYYSENKAGWYKSETISNKDLYNSGTTGSIAGEAASMFVVNNIANGASAKLLAVDTFHHNDPEAVGEKLELFLKQWLREGERVDLLLSGENGDIRFNKFYNKCESSLPENASIARFKHCCGEFTTATSFATWLACRIISDQSIPAHLIKRQGHHNELKNILIYNTYKGIQHGFIILSVA